MKDLDNLKKIAVMIDADNAQYSKLSGIISEISAFGRIVVKRAYGDWSNEILKNWKTVLNELAIQPIQQFSYTTGKNSTDASLIIDTMDLLYSNKFDAFVIVSSDSDFTKLASRLRESEMFVIGVGEKKTPVSFRNACENFIFVENIGAQAENEITKPKTTNKRKTKTAEIPEITEIDQDTLELKKLLTTAWDLYKDDDGWANVSSTGTYIKRLKPDFDPRTYNATKLPEIIENLNQDFEMKKYPGKGTVNIIAYKPIK
ncbi:OST-HTH/LOTUS domain-containing protein [Epilithonimonas bovis DSM 19482]|uniref:OST-HTH/LOTUS domain-containing protein n=1 Tax=Epilithonimonas bovis DSM 19482 TaxID=1121284 RepID=A0A1U7PVZ1_9FLAO|nr:NYN domain-containing protein [Epilithonimonas bovis]SIT97725.1 OST-HTH/LOTUS domain-containing protein [Epilithonimonas bovis DSM 19482]